MNVKRKSFLSKFTRKILLYANIAVAFSLLLSYVAVYLSPGKFWPPAFFGLAFPYVLGANLVFLVFWLILRKLYFLLSMMSIIIGWGHIQNFVQLPVGNTDKNVPTEPSLKIMTYNVRMFDFYRWSDEKSSANKMIQFFQNEKPDILCLQEFYIPKKNTNVSLENIKKNLSWLKNYHIDYINNFMGGMYGVATFSKYPIIHRGSQKFENSVNRVIFTDIVVGNDTLRVFNNHLQSFRLTENNFRFISNLKLEYSDKQIREAKDISKKLRNAYITRSRQVDIISEMIDTSPYQVLVCGDFNDTPVSYTYRKMKGDLKDSFVVSGKGVSNTYHGRTPGFRIDFIFHSSQLHSANYKKHNVKYSDHYPVSTMIHLNN